MREKEMVDDIVIGSAPCQLTRHARCKSAKWPRIAEMMDGWGELWASETEGQLLSIPLVAGEMDSHWPKEPLSQEKKDELLMWMIAGAGRAYRQFADARREGAEDFYVEPLDDEDEYYPETFVRAEPKVGRNEPCPCGSGKKYKKCCGAM